MTDKPAPEKGARRDAAAGDPTADDYSRQVVDDPTEDTEGHSLSLLLGLGALDRAREQERSRPKAKEEELPPLTKPFPAMKDETRK